MYQLHRAPYGGYFCDDKLNLWKLNERHAGTVREFGDGVIVPETFLSHHASWEELRARGDIAFKARSEDHPLARQAVYWPGQLRDGSAVHKAYERQEMIGQRIVPSYLVDDRPVQLVILCIGSQPVTGYVQHAKAGTRCINDNSELGPLLLKT